jgi:hypothetical protein
MSRFFTFLLLILSLPVLPIHAQEVSCSPLPYGLAIGLWARVASGDAHNLRAEPTTTADVVDRIAAGDIFHVLDGPQCADGYIWWEVNYVGETGWTAESDLSSEQPWLEPLAGQPEIPVDYDNDPEGCLTPPDDYTRFTVNGAQVNLRTLAMLDYAQAIYTTAGGIIDFRDAIMQGSYNPGGVSASFGTHDGGGALDLSLRSPITGEVVRSEIKLMLSALRLAGFAAWLRDTDSLYPGSPIHIHAIAIGDTELSEAAREQIDGEFGYFRGYDGLPQEDGIAQPDTSDKMILCGWMIDLGFTDLRPDVE